VTLIASESKTKELVIFLIMLLLLVVVVVVASSGVLEMKGKIELK
jgi:hypothetical protein